jgi:hypothetical protein
MTARFLSSDGPREIGFTLLLIAVLSLGAVFVTRALLPASLRLDVPTDYESQYLPTGRSIAEGRGITRPNGDISTSVPPGYPLIIAGVVKMAGWLGADFDELMNLAIAIFFALSAVMLYLASREVWCGRGALIPPLLWILCPFSLWLAQSPNVEVPFFVFLFLAMALFFAGFHRTRTASLFFFCGVNIGIAMLIRPIAVVMGVMFAALVVLFERRHRMSARLALALLILAGNAAIVAPLEMWLYAHSNQVMPLSSNGPANLRLGLTFGINSSSNGQRSLNLPDRVVEVMAELNNRLTTSSSQADIMREALAVFRDRPISFTHLIIVKALRSWYGTDSGRAEHLTLLVQLPFVTLMVLGLIFTVRAQLVPRVVWVTIVLTVLYFWAMSMMVVPLLRYMTPVLGIAFLLIPGVLYPFQKYRTAAASE